MSLANTCARRRRAMSIGRSNPARLASSRSRWLTSSRVPNAPRIAPQGLPDYHQYSADADRARYVFAWAIPARAQVNFSVHSIGDRIVETGAALLTQRPSRDSLDVIAGPFGAGST